MERFMDYRLSYKILVYSYIITFVIAVLGYGFSGGMFLAILAICTLSFGIIQSIFFLKCPDCHEYLNVRGQRPNHCANCGKKLDRE